MICTDFCAHTICVAPSSWHTASVTASPTTLPDLELLDPSGLKALILSQHEQLLACNQEQLLSRRVRSSI